MIGRTLHFSLSALTLVAFFAAGCVGTTVQPDAGLQEAKEEQPAPNITLSLNCLNEAVVFSGAPILVEAVLSRPDGRDSASEVSLSGPGGTWGELISVEIRNAQNEAVPGISFQSLVTTEQSITLNGEVIGALAWCIVSETGATLPPGEYSVVVLLDATTSGGGWNGKTKSAPSTLIVKSNASQLSADEARLVTLADVRINLYLNNNENALALADAYLAKHPKDGLMMEERADSLAKAGMFAEAVVAYDAAIANVAPQEESLLREPPHLLLRKREMAAEAAKGDGTK